MLVSPLSSPIGFPGSRPVSPVAAESLSDRQDQMLRGASTDDGCQSPGPASTVALASVVQASLAAARTDAPEGRLVPNQLDAIRNAAQGYGVMA